MIDLFVAKSGTSILAPVVADGATVAKVLLYHLDLYFTLRAFGVGRNPFAHYFQSLRERRSL